MSHQRCCPWATQVRWGHGCPGWQHPAAPDPPPLAQADDPQLLPVFVLEPLDALELGVHEQGPALGVAEDGGILGGRAVAGQPLVAPGSHVSSVGEETEGVQPWGDGDGHLPGRSCWVPGQGGAGAPPCGQALGEGVPRTPGWDLWPLTASPLRKGIQCSSSSLARYFLVK